MQVDDRLLGRIRQYLGSRAAVGDREAIALLQEFAAAEEAREQTRQLSPSEFPALLFKTWQAIADEQVGDNFWSYPIPLEEISESLAIPIEQLCAYLASASIPNLQLIPGRGHNHQIGEVAAASLTFHPETAPEQAAAGKAKKAKKSGPTATSAEFAIGDRVRVTAKRPQYVNQIGTVDQIISVSCRVKLDNGWTAFLPKDCLEKM